MSNRILDTLTRKITAFESFSALVDAPGYRPTLPPRDTDHIDLADAYDAFQSGRGDQRRAFRGIGNPSLVAPRSPEGFASFRLAGVPAGSGLYADWLRVIHLINGAAKSAGLDLLLGSPESHDSPDGSFVEEYPDFRVVLRHTAWGNGENSGTIQAKSALAAALLASAVTQVAKS